MGDRMRLNVWTFHHIEVRSNVGRTLAVLPLSELNELARAGRITSLQHAKELRETSTALAQLLRTLGHEVVEEEG